MKTFLRPTIYRLCPLALAMALAACSQENPATRRGETMGTTWSLLAVHGTDETAQLIQKHLDHREAVFSHWMADSPLSRFNDSASTDWFPVPEELVKVVKAAHQISLATQGALDITVGGQVEALGFGAPGKTPSPPTTPKIGWSHLQWREMPPALKKEAPEVRIHVASVVEGFVMDELVEKLKKQGLSDFLLEIGGEVAAIGHASDGQPWRVGIQAPDAEQGETLETLSLTDLCVATSGSYRHRFEKMGRIYSHLVDPRTGRPIEHKLVSVSVIHPSCLLADGYATALMVLGPQEGHRVAQDLGLRVIWLEEP